MKEPDGADGDVDGVVGALGERWSAEIERVSVASRLAFAETRLAASSGIALVGIALAIVALAMLIWLLLVALVGYGLWRLGIPLAIVLLALLGAHVAAALVLALLARRLLRDLTFVHTRRALAGAGAGAAPPPARTRSSTPDGSPASPASPASPPLRSRAAPGRAGTESVDRARD